MVEFCGVHLRSGVPSSRGDELVSDMLAGRGPFTDARVETPADRLCLGFAVAAGRPLRGPVTISKGAGRVTFGDAMLWNADIRRDGADMDRLHQALVSDGDPARLNGDYAAGTLVQDSNTLTLFRDPVGTRTIVYAQVEDGLAFATNPRLLAGVRPQGFEPDRLAMAAYLLVRHPGVGRFYLSGMQQLQAGHSLAVVDGNPGPERPFWWFEAVPRLELRSQDAWIAHLRETLVRAIATRLHGSERPAVLFSGGLDSSTIACIAADLDPGREVLCIAHAPGPGPRPHDPHDDAPYRQVLADSRPNIRLIEVTSNHIPLLDGAAHWFRQGMIPSTDTLYPGTAAMEEMALAMGADVVLNGMGGDDALSVHAEPLLTEALASGRLGLARQEYRRRRERGESARSILYDSVLRRLVPGPVRRMRQRWLGRDWLSHQPLTDALRAGPDFQQLVLELGADDMFRPEPNMHDMVTDCLSPYRALSLVFKDRIGKETAFRTHSPLLDIDLIGAIAQAPSDLFVSPSFERMLIRRVADPWLPAQIKDRPGKAPFMPDLAARAAETCPTFLRRLEQDAEDPLWHDLVDIDQVRGFAAKTGQNHAEDPARKPDIIGIGSRLMVPALLADYLKLVRSGA